MLSLPLTLLARNDVKFGLTYEAKNQTCYLSQLVLSRQP